MVHSEKETHHSPEQLAQRNNLFTRGRERGGYLKVLSSTLQSIVIFKVLRPSNLSLEGPNVEEDTATFIHTRHLGWGRALH